MEIIRVVPFKVPNDDWEYGGKNINFNPSIIHMYENIFLVSFHTFRRGPKKFTKKNVIASIYDKYHPWYGGYDSNTWWNTEPYGFHGTGLMIIKIVNHKVIFHSIIKSTDYGSDMRLLKTPKFIFATFNLQAFNYNGWGSDRELYNLPKAICTHKCLAMQYFTARIQYNGDKDKYKIEKNNEYSLLCSNVQDQDKNWSSFVLNNKIYCSDYLTPRHTVVNVDNCSVSMESHNNIMQEIELYYGQGLVFSLSTPAIAYNNNFLAVGHIKIRPPLLEDKTTNAYLFVNDNILPKHPFYDQLYMMFLYTFDKNLNILSISPAFYPPETKNAVVFPAGLTYYNNEFIISYGEADMEMKLLFLNETAVNNLLEHDIDNEYGFLYM